MIFYDTSSSAQGIVNDVWFRTSTDINQFPIADITRLANEAYSRAAYIIMEADGRMTWDDPNHSNQPIATADLFAGQSEYNIFSSAPSALQNWLSVQRVDIMDSGGAGVNLTEIDQTDFKGIAQSEFNNVPSLPYAFDFNGTMLRLYPAPDYSYANGMTIWFDRAPSYFLPTDTTKQPGFDVRFHPYISIYVSNQFNGSKKKDWSLQPIVQQMEQSLGLVYAIDRNKAEQPIITRRTENYI